MAGAAAGVAKARAFGRAIGHFGTPIDWERELIDAACQGSVAGTSAGISAPRTVRAELVRFLALGGDDTTPVHEKGVQIQDMRIEGVLDLRSATLVGNLTLLNCKLTGELILHDAQARTIDLTGSSCSAISADRVECANLFLRGGFKATGVVRLIGAKIARNFDCDGGKFEGHDPHGYALNCERLEVGGGIHLRGGFLAKGAVRLLGAKVGGNLECTGRFEGRDMQGNALHCERMEAGGGVFLRKGFVANAGVRLLGAKIGKNLDCERGDFQGADKGGNALHCERVECGGNVLLTRIVVAKGAVRLLESKVDGNLECDGGKFGGGDRSKFGGVDRSKFEVGDGHRYALHCERIVTGGSVRLRDGFSAVGTVRLLNATIGRDLECYRGTFGRTVAKKDPQRTQEPVVLDLGGAQITGTLWLVGPKKVTAIFLGGVDLTGAKIGGIADGVTEPPSPETASERGMQDPRRNPVFLRLDGLTYDRFDGESDLTGGARIAFLDLQPKRDLGAEFKPQPWLQMIKVLRAAGHDAAARAVAMEQRRASRRSGKVPWNGRLLSRLYGALFGYGYRPVFLVLWAAGFIVISAIVYKIAAANGVMVPADWRIRDTPPYADCRSRLPVNWTECTALKFRYTAFNPILYSIELAVPIIPGSQTKDWRPNTVVACSEETRLWICWHPADIPDRAEAGEGMSSGYSLAGLAVAVWAWFENLLGWLAGLMLVALASGLIKKD